MHALLTTFFTRYPRKSIRLLEVIPPLLAVFLISMPFWGAIYFPALLSYFIIFFNMYWLYKSVNLAVCSFISSRKIRQAEREDWLKLAKVLPNFSKISHVVIIPTYQESITKIKETLDSIKTQTFSKKQVFVFVAFEERETEARGKAEELNSEYANFFGGLYYTFHPDNPNEVKGKSSNQAYAGRLAEKVLVETRKIDINYATISSVDADCIFDPQFFAYLTYKFLKSSDRHYKFFQSANVTYNNFWQVPSFIRIIAFFSSLWRISLLVQGLRLIPNSVYSLSSKLLKQID